MSPIRHVIHDAPEFIPVPPEFQHRPIELISVMLRNGKEDSWIQTNLIAIFNYTHLQPLKAISDKGYTNPRRMGGT